MQPIDIAKHFASTETLYGLAARISTKDEAKAIEFLQYIYDQCKHREKMERVFGKEIIAEVFACAKEYNMIMKVIK